MRRELWETVAAKWEYIADFAETFQSAQWKEDGAAVFLRGMARCEPIWLSADIQEIIHEASAKLNDWAPHINDFIVPYGFLLFGGDDVAGFAGFFWIPIGVKEAQPQRVGFCALPDLSTGGSFTMEGFDIGAPILRGGKLQVATQIDLSPEPAEAQQSRDIIRFFAATQLLLSQHVLATSHHHLPRHEARRQQRLGREPEEIRVVELRRREPIVQNDDDGNHQKRDWQWQWVVRGHWRHYETGKTSWVHPYVKGPEERPLKPPGGRIFDVRR